MAPRGGGLSNKNKVSYGRVGSSSIKQTIIPVNKTALQRAASQRTYNDMIAGLSFVQRDEMLELGQDIDMPYTYSEDDLYYLGEPDDDEWVDVPTGIHAFPPGEEAIPQSHAGGEAIMHQIMEVGFEESGERLFSHPADITRTNQTLLHHGYIGGSPEKPAIVFSIRTFEIYRQAHRVCPRYTINSLAKTLSHLHKVPRKSYLAEQLTTAYNAYLVILREVDLRVQRALGRDETWNSKNIKLTLSWLGSLDGNNSLKLVDSTFRAGHPRFDNRKSSSFRWLTPSEVDKYMNEVKNAPKVSMVTFAAMAAVTAALATSPITYVPPDNPDRDVAWLNVNELNTEEVNELERCVNTCVERWKAAGPEAQKKMFALFAISGIFISVCHHGHVLVMCNMIRSGELMKYLLAIVAKLFELYGVDAGIGYDIMCAFFKTLLRSSLGRKTVGLRMHGIVLAFHGHAHNRMCQLGWRPIAGLEDFEECERTFCLSNNLASCTQLVTPFHRQQQIDEHFYFHDLDKHASSGRARTLESLLREPPEVQTAADYMELLAKLQSATDTSDKARQQFNTLNYQIIRNHIKGPEITVIRTRYRTMYTRLLQVEEEVSRFEEEHGYKRCYWRALDKLECLVVQRLLELTKLSMSGVAYKLREKIGKARSMLNPPREKLVWAEVIQTVTLAEFNLLRDTRTDIRKLPWTQLARREAGLLAIVNTQMTDPNLAHELSKRWNYMVWINDSVVKCLVKTS
ncbi:hypothetical protein DFH09DRAFT_1318585 [Mycena vulgaris]|nr:hypothetical protein DFH09DRAFT_1318585 [Mycena vulgaris]